MPGRPTSTGSASASDGRLTPAPGSPFAAQRIGPFGSTFSPTHGNQLFVSNAHDGANAGSVSVYDVAADGSLSAISGSPFADNQTAPCWVAMSPDGHALFAVNTAVPSISRYAVAADGTLTLAGSTAFSSPAGLRPFDAQVSPDGGLPVRRRRWRREGQRVRGRWDVAHGTQRLAVLDPGRRRSVRDGR